MTKMTKVSIDNPIKSSKQDELKRAQVAKDFAKNIRKLDAKEGFVVGVLGAWGSGKSSFVNLMREEFGSRPKLTVIDFNPWMFSGSQQLVDAFFREISAELRIKDEKKFGKIAGMLNEYGDILSPIAMLPFVGDWWDRSFRSFRTIHKMWKDKKNGSQTVRQKVSEALMQLESPVIVVIDDIDRLTTEEIRDIFKLVRLTASFPNLIYILAFDRYRIELALDETNIPGRAYLEKIIQLSFDLPAISQDILRSKIVAEFNTVLGDVKNLRFDEERWPDVFIELIVPMIENLRDISRLATSARPVLEVLGADVDAVDIMALESIRVFRPTLFEQLHKHKTLLTKVSDSYHDDTSRQQTQIDQLITAADGDKEYIDNLIQRIFPAAQKYTANTHYGYDSLHDWRRVHRVAHIDFLSLYLERNSTEGLLAFRRAEEAFSIMDDTEKLEIFLNNIKPDELNDAIASLEAYEHAFEPNQIIPGCVVLLNLISKIPEKKNPGIFDLGGPDLTVDRVILRMMRTINEESEREVAANEIIKNLNTYSARLDFITLLGHKEGSGHKLVSKVYAAQVEQDFMKDLEKKRPADFENEWSLLGVYWFYLSVKGDEYEAFKFDNPNEIRKVFETSRTVMRSQTWDTRNVKYEEHLAWDALVKIFGTEDAINVAVNKLKKSDGNTVCVNLVEKYISGWRPSR